MRWIVFGDDWGAHPSTTQHLILNMPSHHRAVWVDSIGMRTPTLSLLDLRRVASKLGAMLDPSADARSALYAGSIGDVARLKPKVLPWHAVPAARRYNARWLRRAIGAACAEWPPAAAVLLAANPVAACYADDLPHDALVYLRLDEYKEYPGCDRDLVESTERLMYEKADAIIATAQSLLPSPECNAPSYYLPQGVQADVFSLVTLEPPRAKILGFFGTIAKWLDFALIDEVARLAPDWELHFVGKQDHVPQSLRSRSNIVLRPPVPFVELPKVMSQWTAAWIPFEVNSLTIGVNPLKVREYLSGGLPTHCTPLPEIAALGDAVHVSADAADIVAWMNRMLTSDSSAERNRRRASVAADSWSSRAAQLVSIVEGIWAEQGKRSFA